MMLKMIFKMNGLEFSQKTKEASPDMPVIICTGHSSLIDGEKFNELNIEAFEMKPVSISKIARTIRSILDGYS